MTRQLGALLVSGVNKFSGKCQGKIHHVVVEEEKITPSSKKKLWTTEKVTTIKGVEKGAKKIDDMKEAVFTMPLLKRKLLTTEKVTTSEEVDKGTKNLDNMKEAVVTLRRKDSYNF